MRLFKYTPETFWEYNDGGLNIRLSPNKFCDIDGIEHNEYRMFVSSINFKKILETEHLHEAKLLALQALSDELRRLADYYQSKVK